MAGHVALLIGACTLPLVGLAIYFLSTGLHREIALAERERVGLAHVRKTVSALQGAVRLAWSGGGDPSSLRDLDAALAALEEAEAEVSASLPTGPVVLPSPIGGAAEGGIRNLWEGVRKAEPGSRDHSAALARLASRLHQGIFQTSNRSGLSSGPENEISALTDVVAVCLPLHVERLLHMHERMVADLRTKGWDPATREAAAIFARQIDEEDVKRLERSIGAALYADAQSSRVLSSFQSSYPAQAAAMVESLDRLASAVRPMEDGGAPAVAPAEFDGVLGAAFESAVTGWNASIGQLDSLISEQIHEAEAHRNRALWVAAAVSVLLLPASWSYFRFFIRPLMQAMVGAAAKLQREADEARADADETTRRLRQTQDALYGHSAIAAVGLDRRIVAVNDRLCRISGFSREELLGREFTASTDSAAGLEERVWASASNGRSWQGNLRHVTKEGRPVWVNATIFPFVDRSGRVAEFVVIETDITELVHAREAAEAAVRAKGQFLAMMSHEIRTPMNGVIGFSQLLAETPLDEEQRDYVRTILTSGESLLGLINDILDFSKLEAGGTELDSRPVALQPLVEDTLEVLAAQARTKGLELAYWIEPDVPAFVLADAPRLRQVLLNLAGNAVKFTSAGHVEIVLAVAADRGDGPRRIAFHVRDTGIGIPRERQDQLFKPFSQVDASISRNYGGTGLGLAISQRLVGLMGGRIAVSSDPGKGSDFHFDLPLAEAGAGGQAGAGAGAAGAAGTLSDRRVLVVDDLEANRRLLERIFAQHGAVTQAVHSVPEALEALDAARFDLAVIDYMMPGETGVGLARLIRQRADCRDLPLVLVASVQPGREEKAEELFDAVIMKPLRVQSFAAAAARSLRRGRDSFAPDESRGPPPERFADRHPLRIAVVDDNAVNLRMITLLLRSLGYSPAAFADASTALEVLARKRFDVVLMDVQMPAIDGHEATRRLRLGEAGEASRDSRVIALTAGAMAEERDACLAAGMDDFLSKPVSRSELLKKLAAASADAKR